ncbi:MULTISPECIES: hypothetical protein [Sphingobacterium]|uniref:hypothetical protein n=1 Tax=Sphingobacterium TaxID=28453 RepID=UPI0013DA771B|nr:MULTISPECIES: hypothetical protein [unclassified Sphingobacterium]
MKKQKGPVTGNCKLFGTFGELKHSHIVPKFVLDYFKATGSRYLRAFNEPNQRRQDGAKKYYLSQEAEQLFSIKEKWFAENIFKPFMVEKRDTLQYDQTLYYFSISVLWRVLLEQLDVPEIKNNRLLKILEEVELDWRNYLIDHTYAPKFSDLNLFLSDRIRHHDTGVEGLEYYFTRTIDATVFSDDNGDYVIVYCKFLRFVFWSIIKSPKPNINSDFIIRPIESSISFPQGITDTYFIQTLVERARAISKLPKANDSQQDKIMKEIINNPDSLFQSDAGQAIFNDLKLNGKE